MFQRSLADVVSTWNGYPIHDALAEEGKDSPIPSTVPGVANLIDNLQEAKHPDTYTKAIATLAYAAQRAKLASGPEKQRWADLFIDSFRLVYSDITGDPNKALGLC